MSDDHATVTRRRQIGGTGSAGANPHDGTARIGETEPGTHLTVTRMSTSSIAIRCALIEPTRVSNPCAEPKYIGTCGRKVERNRIATMYSDACPCGAGRYGRLPRAEYPERDGRFNAAVWAIPER